MGILFGWALLLALEHVQIAEDCLGIHITVLGV